jgi:3-oxoacyl-[acyl-carrier-protein] synthase-1
MNTPLHVSCMGLVSAVGMTPESACAAMRGRISGFQNTPFKDNEAATVIGAMVPSLSPGLRGSERLASLLKAALIELPRRLPPGLAVSELPVLLCTREPERPGGSLQGLLQRAEAELPFRLGRAHAQHLPEGSTSAFSALTRARLLLTEHGVQACLIVAVDSFMDVRALHWLDQHQRLKKDGHTDGLVPGEAACVTLVSLKPVPGLSALGVNGIGFGEERATVFNDEPLRGEGMARAVGAALDEADMAMQHVAFRLSDVGGESFAFEEVALAQIRHTRVSRTCQDLLHPASSVGDCGAANGLLQLAWAEQAMHRRYACGPVALAHLSAPAGLRAAAVLTAATRKGR